MTEKEQREIFAKNFRKYVDGSNKSQREIAKALGYSYTTVNTWYRGAAMPNAAKVQTLADYFGIRKSDLLDASPIVPTDGHTDAYYLNPETAKVAQKVFDNPNYRILFDAAADSAPEDILMVAEMLRRFKEAKK